MSLSSSSSVTEDELREVRAKLSAVESVLMSFSVPGERERLGQNKWLALYRDLTQEQLREERRSLQEEKLLLQKKEEQLQEEKLLLMRKEAEELRLLQKKEEQRKEAEEREGECLFLPWADLSADLCCIFSFFYFFKCCL